MKCKFEGTGIWNGRCIGTKEVDPCPGYDKCKQYKPNYTTNADRIRAMTDEELARALYGMQKEVCTHIAIAVGFSPEELNFADEAPDILNWLQQPAKGE